MSEYQNMEYKSKITMLPSIQKLPQWAESPYINSVGHRPTKRRNYRNQNNKMNTNHKNTTILSSEPLANLNKISMDTKLAKNNVSCLQNFKNRSLRDTGHKNIGNTEKDMD